LLSTLLISLLLEVKDYPLLVTTVEQLQDVVETIRKKFKHCKVLTILVSAEIDALYPFNVGSRIQTLRIFRCSSDEFRDGVLLIPGNSTFNRISLGRWQEKARNRHKLLLGTNVGVKVDSNWHAPAASSNELTEDQKEALKTYLEAMQKGGKHKKWWNEWKGPVAAILGLVVTTGQIAMDLKVAAGGAFVSFECAAFSLQTGAAWFQASTVTTVMGPAVLLGVGVAAAVYFIPWGDLISWIRGLVSSLSSWFVSLWGEFLSWLSKCQEEIQTRSSRLKSSY